jgi:hypothetical protein
VIYRCEGDLHPNLVVEILEHCAVEVLGVIDCNLPMNLIVGDDVSPKKIFG